MKQIIAIGGGGFASASQNLKIERYLLEQTHQKQPKVCFLPQASNEAPEYIIKFYDTFSALGAKPSWISLFGSVPNGWESRLLDQDLIYVGGGNTRSMLALWREWKMDHVLKKAYEKGIVLCGISAGAICWFEQCITDSVWPLGALNGLGLLSGSCCPHYDSEPERRPTFQTKINSAEVKPGIALEDFTAAHFVDGALKQVVISVENKKAYRVAQHKETELPRVLL